MFARVTIRVTDVDASARFYETVLATLGRERPVYGPDYYGAFLLDPDGNSAEAVHHDRVVEGRIDHLWIRVADVQAGRAFYLGFGETAGFVLRDDTPVRVQFAPPQGSGSFSLVAGDAPTEHVRMTFAGAPARVEPDPDGNVAEVA